MRPNIMTTFTSPSHSACALCNESTLFSSLSSTTLKTPNNHNSVANYHTPPSSVHCTNLHQ